MLLPLNIARYLIQLSYRPDSPEESDLLCPLRIQKLLYYVQGWSLALRQRALFEEEIEAWPMGPVVPSVYRQLKGFGAQVVMPVQVGEPCDIPAVDAKLIETVWKEYGRYSANELIRMTHNERPWKDARNALSPTAKSSAILSKESLKAFFEDETKKYGLAGIDPCDEWEALEDYKRDGGISGEELFGELLGER